MLKVGVVTIIGKANVGKSTLTNAFVGEKVSIVTFRPQTTRDRILGIANGDNYQIMVVDTPGIHTPKNKLSEYMMKNVSSSLEGVDAIIYMIACDKKLDQNEIEEIEKLSNKETPLIVAINKCDEAKQEVILEKITKLQHIKNIVAIVPISARYKKNLDLLTDEVVKLLPEEENRRYDLDEITDKSTRFIVAEYIREKTLTMLSDEIPYGIGVVINTLNMQGKVIEISADIICEKQAHKAIIIGKAGSMIKKISTQARIDIENLLQQKVFLEVYVKVKENWRDNPSLLNNLGYSNKLI